MVKNTDVHVKTEKRYQLFKGAFSNLSAGMLIAYLTFPAEALKKLKQNTGFGLIDLFRKQREADGLSGLQTIKKALRSGVLGSTPDGQPYKFYRGSSIFALNIIPTTFTQLTVEKKLNEFYPKENATVGTNIFKSILSGVIGASTATVVENCIVRQQELKEDRLLKGLNDIYKNRGLTGFWKSYPLIATRDGIFTFCMLWANPEVQKYVHQHYPGSVNEAFAALTVGILGATISHPFDVAATRMQLTHNPMTLNQAYHDVINRFQNHQGFFKGLSYRIFLFTAFSNGIPYFKKQAEDMFDNRAKPLLLSTESQFLKNNKKDESDQHVQPSSAAKMK